MNTVTPTACTGADLPSMSETVALYDAVGWSAYTQHPDALMAGLRFSQFGEAIPGRTFVRFGS